MKMMAEVEVQAVRPVEMPRQTEKSQKSTWPMILVALAIVVSGAITGYFLTGGKIGKKPASLEEAGEKITKGMIFGIDKPEIYRDTTEGVVEVNDGSLVEEGSHKLIREGGDSKTAYLVSSTLDLDKLVGHKVKIWGETFAGQKAGWLMNVGKIEVLE